MDEEAVSKSSGGFKSSVIKNISSPVDISEESDNEEIELVTSEIDALNLKNWNIEIKETDSSEKPDDSIVMLQDMCPSRMFDSLLLDKSHSETIVEDEALFMSKRDISASMEYDEQKETSKQGVKDAVTELFPIHESNIITSEKIEKKANIKICNPTKITIFPTIKSRESMADKSVLSLISESDSSWDSSGLFQKMDKEAVSKSSPGGFKSSVIKNISSPVDISDESDNEEIELVTSEIDALNLKNWIIEIKETDSSEKPDDSIVMLQDMCPSRMFDSLLLDKPHSETIVDEALFMSKRDISASLQYDEQKETSKQGVKDAVTELCPIHESNIITSDKIGKKANIKICNPTKITIFPTIKSRESMADKSVLSLISESYSSWDSSGLFQKMDKEAVSKSSPGGFKSSVIKNISSPVDISEESDNEEIELVTSEIDALNLKNWNIEIKETDSSEKPDDSIVMLQDMCPSRIFDSLLLDKSHSETIVEDEALFMSKRDISASLGYDEQKETSKQGVKDAVTELCPIHESNIITSDKIEKKASIKICKPTKITIFATIKSRESMADKSVLSLISESDSSWDSDDISDTSISCKSDTETIVKDDVLPYMLERYISTSLECDEQNETSKQDVKDLVTEFDSPIHESSIIISGKKEQNAKIIQISDPTESTIFAPTKSCTENMADKSVLSLISECDSSWKFDDVSDIYISCESDAETIVEDDAFFDMSERNISASLEYDEQTETSKQCVEDFVSELDCPIHESNIITFKKIEQNAKIINISNRAESSIFAQSKSCTESMANKSVVSLISESDSLWESDSDTFISCESDTETIVEADAFSYMSEMDILASLECDEQNGTSKQGVEDFVTELDSPIHESNIISSDKIEQNVKLIKISDPTESTIFAPSKSCTASMTNKSVAFLISESDSSSKSDNIISCESEDERDEYTAVNIGMAESGISALYKKSDDKTVLEYSAASPDIPETKIVSTEIKCVSATVPKANLLPDVAQDCNIVQPQVSKADLSSRVFYGISVTEEYRRKLVMPLIVETKKKALDTIRKYPNSRFREFSTFGEALRFASLPAHLSNPLTLSSVNSYITSQQLAELRKTIETGNEQHFLELVYSNPRYLINFINTPTILQEGTQNNALHVAARYRQTSICISILTTLRDFKFVSLLYPEDTIAGLKQRITHILQMYLNMPDKALLETPLHYASKFGAEVILEVFLSYPECDKKRCNKFGIIPRDMVCERSIKCSEDVKHRMYWMFEDNISYIPIKRDVCNIKEPQIGSPCSADFMMKAVSSSPFIEKESQQVSCAFIGPMSYEEAECFHNLWKRKRFIENLKGSKEEKKMLKNICRSDSVKGLERIGRKIADDLNCGWIEYWPTLDFWIDLSSDRGLQLLEAHLQIRSVMISFHSSDMSMKKSDSFLKLVENGFVDDFVANTPYIYANKRKVTFFDLFKTLIPHTLSMSDCSFSNDLAFLELIHDELGHLLYLKLLYSTNNNELADFIIYLHTQLIDKYVSKSRRWEMLSCILLNLYYYYSLSSQINKPQCTCDWFTKDVGYNYSSETSYYSILKARQDYYNKICTESSIYPIEESTAENLPSGFEKNDDSKALILSFSTVSLDFKILNQTEGYVQESKPKATQASTTATESLENRELEELKGFITMFDKFNNYFLQFIHENRHNIPISQPKESYFKFFKNVMKYFKDTCCMNFKASFLSESLHYEMAYTLFIKLKSELEQELLDMLRTFLLKVDYKSYELKQYGISSSREWMYFHCVLKHLCNFIAGTTDSQPQCACRFDRPQKKRSFQAGLCHTSIKELQGMYKIMQSFTDPVEMDSPTAESLSDDEAFFTPPESPAEPDIYMSCLDLADSSCLDSMQDETFVNGPDISRDDIDMYRAIEKIPVDRSVYPFVFKWKSLVEKNLGKLLKSDTVLSGTFASTSATICRSLKETGAIPKRKSKFQID